MNGTAQRERHTAVAACERRIDDVETVVAGLAQTIVDDREARDQWQHAFVDKSNLALDGCQDRLAEAIADAKRFHQACDARWVDTLTEIAKAVSKENIARMHFQRMTLWQRLRWLVAGF